MAPSFLNPTHEGNVEVPIFRKEKGNDDEAGIPGLVGPSLY